MPSMVAEFLAELVHIDSRSPGRLGEPFPPGASTEEPLARFLAARLEKLGLSSELQWVEPGRPHLVARTPHLPGAPTLAFEAHLDTVGTEGMTIPPFIPDIRTGRLSGRGACDTKGPMAAMLTAIGQLMQEKPGCAPLNLLFLGCCAEETGCEGVKVLRLGDYRPNAVIVGEPTENRVVTGHKAHLWFELTVRGRAAHGSHPEAGDNAIYRMTDVIASLRRFAATRLREAVCPGFTPATLSVGTIRGGTKVNIVPDSCAIMVDVRLLPQQTPELMLEELSAWVCRDSGQPVEVTWKAMAPGFAAQAESPLVHAITAAAETCGVRAPPGVVNYCTDAGTFGAAGYDTVVFGPGSILQAHAAEEFIELSQLETAVEILAETARRYACRPVGGGKYDGAGSPIGFRAVN